MRFSRLAIGFALTSLLIMTAGCRPSDEKTESSLDLAPVKQFLVTEISKLNSEAAVLATDIEAYHEIIKSHDYNYEQAWAKDSARLADLVTKNKDSFIKASTHYELTEGIVAGVPVLADFDVWLDAGPTGEEDPAEARVWTLKLADGREFKNPGNIFHSILEPALWGTNAETSKLAADLDQNGTITYGESLGDAYLLMAISAELNRAAAELAQAVEAWEPSREDVFLALVTMIPTMKEYFGQWQLSYFISGDASQSQAFAAISRLVDVQSILTGLNLSYEALSPEVQNVDEALDQEIKAGFAELMAFVETIYAKEQAKTEPISLEMANQFGVEAQELADTLTGKVAKAAGMLKIQL